MIICFFDFVCIWVFMHFKMIILLNISIRFSRTLQIFVNLKFQIMLMKWTFSQITQIFLLFFCNKLIFNAKFTWKAISVISLSIFKLILFYYCSTKKNIVFIFSFPIFFVHHVIAMNWFYHLTHITMFGLELILISKNVQLYFQRKKHNYIVMIFVKDCIYFFFKNIIVN